MKDIQQKHVQNVETIMRKMEGEKVYECDKRDNKMKNRYFNVEKYMVSFI